MKVAVLAAFLIGGAVEDLVASTHVFGGASVDGRFDPLLLTAFAPLALLAVLVFGYTAWRIEADRAWFRKARTEPPLRTPRITQALGLSSLSPIEQVEGEVVMRNGRTIEASRRGHGTPSKSGAITRASGTNAGRFRVPVLTLTVITVFAFAALPAWSAPGATTTAKIALTPAYGPPLTAVTVKGRGFGPKEPVTVDIAGQLVAGATTDNTGRFHASFRVPSDLLPAMYTVRAVGTISGLTAKRDFDVRTDWPRFRFDDSNTGKNFTESIIGITNVPLLQKKWKFQTGDIVRSSPVVYDHIVYFGSNDHDVYAVDVATGLQRWSFVTGAAVTSVPDVTGGVVYVGSEDHRVYALDAYTGRQLWHFDTNGAVDSSPLVSGGIVYVGSADGSLYALRAGRGPAALKWSFATNAQITTAPAVLGANVYVSSWDDNVYELDAATGRLIHTYQTGDAVKTSPALANCNGIDWLIFGSDDHNVYAYDTDSHALKWTYVTAGDVYSSVAISCSEKDGIVLIGTHNWNMESHSLLDGSLNWLYGGVQCLAVVSSPAVANGVVYYGCHSGMVYALDTWIRDSGPAPPARPARLPVWSYQTGGPIFSSAAVSDGHVFIGSDDGNVYMFGL